MTAAELGYLLLTSPLGDPSRQVMTPAQMRRLKQRLKEHPVENPNRSMEPEDLTRLGYTREQAMWILELLSQTALLRQYLRRGQDARCVPLTWLTPGYPASVLQALKAESPGSIWAKGELSLLSKPCIALVGSRELLPENREFARQVGIQAALQGFTLVSGNARGADRAAQDACLEAGGSVICVVADELEAHHRRQGVLYLAEDGFDLPFTAHRALSRNRLIHSMADKTFVAQSSLHKGGTWGGTLKNLNGKWSRVYCFRDGSAAAAELIRRGALPVDTPQLGNLEAL